MSKSVLCSYHPLLHSSSTCYYLLLSDVVRFIILVIPSSKYRTTARCTSQKAKSLDPPVTCLIWHSMQVELPRQIEAVVKNALHSVVCSTLVSSPLSLSLSSSLLSAQTYVALHSLQNVRMLLQCFRSSSMCACVCVTHLSLFHSLLCL